MPAPNTFLPPDIVEQLDKSGWYAPTPESAGFTGRPQTQEEEAWIVNFVQNTGRVPRLEEVADWKRGQDPMQFTVSGREGNYLGEAGFAGLTIGETANLQGRQGFTYGPGLGAGVPENAVLFTDRQGNPIGRSANLYNFQDYLNQGRFIRPPEGIQGYQDQGFMAKIGPESQYRRTVVDYPAYPAGASSQYTQPSFQEATDRRRYLNNELTAGIMGAGGTPPTMFSAGQGTPEDQYNLYQAQLSDYLQQRVSSDYQAAATRLAEIKALAEKEFAAVTNADEEAAATDKINALLDEYDQQFMTPTRASTILKDAKNLVSWQVPFDQLPLFSDVQGVQGNNTFQWYADFTSRDQQRFDTLANQERQQYLNQYEQARQADQGRYWQPAQPQMFEPSPTDEPDYYQYVSTLQIAGPARQWAMSMYNDLYNLWLNSDRRTRFVEWVDIYFKSGGAV